MSTRPINQPTIVVLSLKNTTPLIETTMSVIIQRPTSIRGLRKLSEDKDYKQKANFVCLVTQKSSEDMNDIYSVGAIAKITDLQYSRSPLNGEITDDIDGESNITARIIVNYIHKIRIEKVQNTEGYIELVKYKIEEDTTNDPEKLSVELALLQRKFNQYFRLLDNYLPNHKKLIETALRTTNAQINPLPKINYICSYLYISDIDPNEDRDEWEGVKAAQKILEESTLEVKCRLLIDAIDRKIDELDIKTASDDEVKRSFAEDYQKAFLRKQLEVINKKLNNDGQSLLDKYRGLLKKVPSEDSRKIIEEEINRLSSTGSGEYTVIKSYLDFVLGLPWGKEPSIKLNLNSKKIRENLDAEHYGMRGAKKQFISNMVNALLTKKDSKSNNSNTLCLVGPPGVGKTSLIEILSKAIGVKFGSISLAGASGDSKLRGHRKTYVGARCGEIMDQIKIKGTTHFLCLLDEIDKISGANINGDISGALMEILDPTLKRTFKDNYLNVEYDISNIIFIATANNPERLHPALIDRLNIIHIPGYSTDDKVEMSKRNLIPKLIKSYNIPFDVKVTDEMLQDIIENYTRPEPGVRGLQINLRNMVGEYLSEQISSFDEVNYENTVNKDISQQGTSEASIIGDKNSYTTDGDKSTLDKIIDEFSFNQLGEEEREEQLKMDRLPKDLVLDINEENILKYLGLPKYSQKLTAEENKTNRIGIVNGLGCTSYGGVVLSIQAVFLSGSGALTITGQAGEVMRESITVAKSVILTTLHKYGYDTKFLKNLDIHIHMPDGGTPKDGPSAGIGIATVFLSLILDKPTKYDVAMTGEVDSAGNVLPIGGLKEKILAACRYGATEVIIPKRNENDIAILCQEEEKSVEEMFRGIKIIYASKIEEVFQVAFKDFDFNNLKSDNVFKIDSNATLGKEGADKSNFKSKPKAKISARRKKK